MILLHVEQAGCALTLPIDEPPLGVTVKSRKSSLRLPDDIKFYSKRNQVQYELERSM